MHTRFSSLAATGIFILLVFYSSEVRAQDDTLIRPVRVMFYNVENFFDTFDDPAKDDNEFLPEGVRRWNMTRYNNKLNSIYKTITAAGEWSPPEIVAFCEVENRKVMKDLVSGTYLSRYNYEIIHNESPDERGIDVGLIYRKESVTIADFKSWIPAGVAEKDYKTRSVLCVKSLIRGDTVYLIVNHWPSRRGGVLAAEDMRTRIAKMVRHAADSIAAISSGRSKIIIMGDFNCNPQDEVMQLLTIQDEKRLAAGDARLVNLVPDKALKGTGTYNYSGAWETIDQILVSEWLINCDTGFSTGKELFRIFRPGFLLRDNPNYPGYTPFSTYRGYRYQGGFSDHLPVLLDLIVRSAVDRN